MPNTIITDYFCGDESQQFQYFRIPRLLITSPRFKDLSVDAKLLYVKRFTTREIPPQPEKQPDPLGRRGADAPGSETKAQARHESCGGNSRVKFFHKSRKVFLPFFPYSVIMHL